MALQNRLHAFFGMSALIIGTIFLARLLNDTGARMVYPFIPQFSSELGLSVVGFSWLIFIRSISGLAGPVFGVLADRIGRRKVMAVSLFCEGVSAIGFAYSQQWWAVGPFILSGLGLAAFIPAQQAYISDQAPFEKRGRALGTVELSWATAGMISLPIIGWLIDAFGWQTPLLILGFVSLIGAALVWLWLPAAEHHAHTTLSPADIWQLSRRSGVLASIAVALLLFLALGIFITFWGVWLSTDFNLKAADLGLVATVIGITELCGSGLSSLFIDRIGIRRGAQLGLLLTATAFLLLPFSQQSLITAVSVLVVIGLVVEFTIVSLLPLYAEQAPQARATIFSLVMLGVSVGVASGSPISAYLLQNYSVWTIGVASSTCVFAALALTAKFLHENSQS